MHFRPRCLMAQIRVGLLWGCVLSVPATAQSDAEQLTLTMDHVTVRILTTMPEGQGTGSGFLVGDGQYVVTNLHVVDKSSAIDVLQGQRSGAEERDVVSTSAMVVHISEAKDLAILRLNEPFSNANARFNPRVYLIERQPVCVVGFPGAGDRNEGQIVEPKFSNGIISAFSALETGTRVIQTDAAVNPGNSGGPLFNECGEVVGVVVQKALAPVMSFNQAGEQIIERVTVGEGIGWAVLVDELLPELEAAGINADVSESKCRPALTSGRDPLSVALLMGTLFLALLALVLALTKRGRASMKTGFYRLAPKSPDYQAQPIHNPSPVATPPIPQPAPNTPVYPQQARPATPDVPPSTPRSPLPPILGLGPSCGFQIKCVHGEHQGRRYEIPIDGLTLGRSPAHAQLVLSSESVSRCHARVSPAERGEGLYLEDMGSSQGTFRSHHEGGKDSWIPVSQRILIRPGQSFCLGSGLAIFQVERV